MSRKKEALGKGLSTLLPQVSPDVSDDNVQGLPSPLYDFNDRMRQAGSVVELEVAKIKSNPYQPRQDFSEDSIAELAASIEQLGIIQPVTVRALEDGTYELIAGERRVRAAKKAGLAKVPAFVREADMEAMLEMAIVENVQREDLNPIEIALGYQRLIDEVGLKQEKVAKKVGKSRSAVTNLLRLLKLPPAIQASLRDGSISAGHARALLAIREEATQLELHQAIVSQGLSVREVERLVRSQRPVSPKKKTSAEPKTPGQATLTPRDRLEIEAFEARLREHLGTKIEIQHKPTDHSGTIQITYFSLEDLERLISQIANY